MDIYAEIGARVSGAELGAKIYGAELGAIRSGAEPLAGRLPVARSSAPVTVAPSSAPLTLAPSQGSISGILSARSLFEKNFRKKSQKVKNSGPMTGRHDATHVPTQTTMPRVHEGGVRPFFS